MATTATTPPPQPLPDLSHLGSADFERVYEPSDDTFLLVDALAADAASLQVRHAPHATLSHAHSRMHSDFHARPHARPHTTQALSAGLCIEIGCGSGAVITHLASLLPRRSAWMLGGDVSVDALRASAATAARNGASLQPVQMDLLSAMRPGLIDVRRAASSSRQATRPSPAALTCGGPHPPLRPTPTQPTRAIAAAGPSRAGHPHAGPRLERSAVPPSPPPRPLPARRRSSSSTRPTCPPPRRPAVASQP